MTGQFPQFVHFLQIWLARNRRIFPIWIILVDSFNSISISNSVKNYPIVFYINTWLKKKRNFYLETQGKDEKLQIRKGQTLHHTWQINYFGLFDSELPKARPALYHHPRWVQKELCTLEHWAENQKMYTFITFQDSIKIRENLKEMKSNSIWNITFLIQSMVN